MPELLTNIATANGYTPACTIGPAAGVAQITFQGFNEPFYATLYKNVPDQEGKYVLEGVERYFPAGALVQFTGIAGAQFRSAIAGQPATINAELAYPTDPLSAYSSTGLFSAAVLTLSFLHNNALQGAESVLDFEDAAGVLTWSVVDTPGTKVAVTPSFTSPAIFPGNVTTTGDFISGTSSLAVGSGPGAQVHATGTLAGATSAATTALLTGTVTGDATDYRFKALVTGEMRWGSGAAAFDTSLQRLGVSILGTNGDFVSGTSSLAVGSGPGTQMHSTGTFAGATSAATGAILTGTVTGDASDYRFKLLVTGEMRWGPGSGAFDTVLSRLAASVLGTAGDAFSTGPTSQAFSGTQTTGVFIGTGNGITAFNSVTFSLINSSLTTDTFARFGINSSGLMQWGTGAAALDTQMSRLAVGVLGMASGDSFTTNGLASFTFGQTGVALQSVGTVWAAAAAAGNNTFVSSVSGDSERRLGIQADGHLVWGSGSAATDLTLGRAVNSPTGTGTFLELTVGAGFGYGVGTGGVIASIVSGSTGTLNKPSGKFTGSAAIATGAFGTYTVNNTCVGVDDHIIVTLVSGGGNIQRALVTAVAAGSFTVLYENGSGVSQTPTINFCVIKGAQS